MRWLTAVAIVAAVACPASAQAFGGQPSVAQTFIETVGTATATACPTTVDSDTYGRTVTSSRCAVGALASVECVRDHQSHTSNTARDDHCTVQVGSTSAGCQREDASGNGYWHYHDSCSLNGRRICGEDREDYPGAPKTQDCVAGRQRCVEQPDADWMEGGDSVICSISAAGRECSVAVTRSYGEITGIDLARTGCRRI